MAISFSPPRSPSTWNPWRRPRTTRGETPSSSFAVGSAPFTKKYLPAKAFWAFTPSSHCRWPAPWVFSGDLYSNFLLSGGGSGTLLGSLGGLAIVDIQLRDPTSMSMGIGVAGGYGIPTVGFCFGDRYKEHAYFKVRALRVEQRASFIAIIDATAKIDVFQRSRLKRIYVIEGMVARFVDGPISAEVSGQTYILTLDVTGTVPDGIDDVAGGKIKIFKKDGDTCELTIKELLPNFDIVVTNESKKRPESGDFYKMETPWCIEDPYMMSGFWYGKEGEKEITKTLPLSTYNLPITSHSIPYNNVKFSGAYVCKSKENGDPVFLPPGTIFAETDLYEWVWIPYEVQTFYPTKDRFFEDETYVDEEGNEISDPNADSVLANKTKKFTLGEESDLNTWMTEDGAKYVRMEIDIGGNPTMQNWHSPILTKCFFTQNGKKFAIVGQPNADVIDVSIRDISDSVNINPSGEGTILNQYAWMINEHFSGDELFYNGKFTSNSYDASTDTSTVTIKANETAFSSGTINQNTDEEFDYLKPNSFYNRFISTYEDLKLKKVWKKFSGWKLSADKSYAVINGEVEFSSDDPVPANPVSVKVKVYGKVEGSLGGLYFDEPYKRHGRNQNISVPTFSFEMYESLENGFPVLCADMSYLSVPIEQFLPGDTIVGITGAKYWSFGRGDDFKDISNEKDLFLMVTTPITQKTVSCFFDRIKEQDWVVFKDKFTENLCFRTANLDFREYPTKGAISIGFSESGSVSGSSPISFDQSKDIVKMVEVGVPEVSDGASSGTNSDDFAPALTFQINNNNDYFGSPSTGSGVFDFEALRKAGLNEGEADFSKYKYKGDFASPVYIYSRKDSVNYVENLVLHLGISTKDKLFVKNGNPNITKAAYIKNKQVLTDVPNFDCHHVNDGEIILFYSKDTHDFTMDGEQVKPQEDPKWSTPKSIYVIGTANSGLQWGTPVFQNLNYNNDKNFQFATMIVNSCDYISSTYDRITRSFIILMRCYHSSNNQSYYGVMTIGKKALTDELIFCEPTDDYKDSDLPFWLKTPQLPTYVANDDNKMYVNSDSKIISPITDGENPESFIRVIGPDGTSCDIESDEIIEIATVCILKVGIPVILYNSEEGIRILSSNNQIKWKKSLIFISKDGSSPVMVDENLFYISPEGIVVITGIRQLLYNATLVSEGEGFPDEIVESLQETIDNLPHILIGSGVIDSQRLSGYTSADGNCKVFYYDKNDILCCLNSKDLVKWKMSYNF